MRSEEPQIRKMRNRVAHQFGITEDDLMPLTAVPKYEALSHTRLTTLMGVVDETAKAIDRHLRTDFVGDFETIELYARWATDAASLQQRTNIAVDPRYGKGIEAFKKFLGAYVGIAAGKAYCSDLYQFYRAL